MADLITETGSSGPWDILERIRRKQGWNWTWLSTRTGIDGRKLRALRHGDDRYVLSAMDRAMISDAVGVPEVDIWRLP